MAAYEKSANPTEESSKIAIPKEFFKVYGIT